MSYTKEEIAIKLEEIINQTKMVYIVLTKNYNYKVELDKLNEMKKDFLDMI